MVTLTQLETVITSRASGDKYYIKVNEELCYGTTLGLQSSPPEEPCQLAHSLIRLVRFSSFLSRLPHSSASSGFGGGGANNTNSWDRGLVGRAALIVLKCVALTTREARVESSSGESDSSMSSRLVGCTSEGDINS